MRFTTGVKIIGFFLAVSAIVQPLPTGADDTVQAQSDGAVFTVRPAMREVRLTGYTRARYIMDIISEEAGRCVKVTADVGDQIRKDGLFAVLDTTFIDLSIKKNRVDQQRLENLISYHNKEVRRFKELVERETAAQSQLDSLQNKLDQTQFQIQLLKVQEAELKERRRRHHIRVPQGWSIIERTVEPGEWIPVGTPLGKAGDFRTLLVPFSLSPQEYSSLMKLNNQVELRLPDSGEKGTDVIASVERVSPDFDPETRKINVELALSGDFAEMRGGLRAELTLKIPDPSNAVLVPASSVAERYEEFWLTRVNGEKIRVLFLGNGPGNTYRVRSPELKPGDKFKTKP